MKLEKLINILKKVGDSEVIGVLASKDTGITYNEIYYFYNPVLDTIEGVTIEDYINSMLDTVFYTEYELEEKGNSLQLVYSKEVTFRDILKDNIRGVMFYQPLLIV